MPKGQQFSQDMKQIFFNVIKFVEKEKSGAVIPFFNVNERLSSMLGISLRSVERLKSEVRDIKHDMIEKKRKIDKENEAVEKHELEIYGRLRKI